MLGHLQRVARVAVLTPAQRGAIAVLRVWGPDALALADRVFQPFRRGKLATSPPNRLRLGRIGSGLGDEVVAVVLDSDPSAKGNSRKPPSVEIQCHGGLAATELVIQAFVEQGAVRSNADEWATQRETSLIQAAAWHDVSQAQTVRTAEILLEQAQGALDRELKAILFFLHSASEETTTAATRGIEQLIARGALGVRLLKGWRVALTGRPNVGKSSLLNALAGFPRAIIHESPGTTRDVVSVDLAIDGWPIEVSDTAGIRATTGELEASGIQKARQAISQSDLSLLILDASQPLLDADREMIGLAQIQGTPIVINKADLPSAWNPAELEVNSSRVRTVSAREGTGVAELVTRIGQCLVADPPRPGEGIPFRVECIDSLRDVAELLKRGDRPRAAERILLMLEG